MRRFSARVGAGEGQATWFQPNLMVVKATAESTGGVFGLVESWVPAGASPPLHVHHREDESFWVLEGHLRFRCGDEGWGPLSATTLERLLGRLVESDDVRVLSTGAALDLATA